MFLGKKQLYLVALAILGLLAVSAFADSLNGTDILTALEQPTEAPVVLVPLTSVLDPVVSEVSLQKPVDPNFPCSSLDLPEVVLQAFELKPEYKSKVSVLYCEKLLAQLPDHPVSDPKILVEQFKREVEPAGEEEVFNAIQAAYRKAKILGTVSVEEGISLQELEQRYG